MSLRILLAEESGLVRDWLRSFLERHGCTVVAEADNDEDALRLAGQIPSDVALVGLSPARTGLNAARQMRRVSRRTRTIIMSQHNEDSYILASLVNGAMGYILKESLLTDLLIAIREVRRGHVYVGSSVCRRVTGARA
jgi:DNA-binding NarL/FixJ family response regulator